MSISLYRKKSFYTRMMWFFRQFEKGTYSKTAMEAVFGHLQSPDLKARCVWTEYQTEFFIKFIKEKTGILDSKPQRNTTSKTSEQK